MHLEVDLKHLFRFPHAQPISLTAKLQNDKRHELYDLVMERVSRTYATVCVVLEAISKSHTYAVADGSQSSITNVRGWSHKGAQAFHVKLSKLYNEPCRDLTSPIEYDDKISPFKISS